MASVAYLVQMMQKRQGGPPWECQICICTYRNVSQAVYHDAKSVTLRMYGELKKECISFSLINPCDMHRSQLLPDGLVHGAQMDGEATEADTRIKATLFETL